MSNTQTIKTVSQRSGTRFHFAGINARALAEHTKGQDVLVSYADLRSPSCWEWMRPLLEGGHWRSVVLDSGAFTVYAAKIRAEKKDKAFKGPLITVEAYAAFVDEHGGLFDWIANLDDIGGDTAVSNANFDILKQVSNRIVPVWHEGESNVQLLTVIAQAKAAGRIAIGMQRPKGSLRPKNVVACLKVVVPKIRALRPDLKLHGFGLTRYASADTCPGGPGWAFDSVDSTTWIAEACAVERSGAVRGERIEARVVAFRATVDSYQGVAFLGGIDHGPRHGARIDLERALEAGGQAGTVARRLQTL